MADIYAGVDLGGTKVACALGSIEQEVIVAKTAPTESQEGHEAVLARVADVVEALAEEAGAQPAALAMGVPGLADLRNGVTRFLPNLPGKWRDVPVRDALSPRLGCPVYLINDVRCATLAELTFGHGRTARTMAFFAIGTGIGGGVVVGGRLHLGPLGAAGELGHHTIVPDGPLCGCGNRGCLEALASGSAITAEGVRLLKSGQCPKLHEIVDGDASRVTPRELAAAAEAGDEAAATAIRRAAEYIGIAVANVIVTIHPDLVVFGGGVAEIGAILIDPIRETIRRRVHMLPVDDIRIERSQLGERAGVLGAIALAEKGGLVPA
ncbi:MAG: ROK family protein [Armatimonadota bacterium]